MSDAREAGYSRNPDRGEVESALSFFERHCAVLSAEADRSGKNAPSLSLPDGLPEGADRLEAATLVDFCHMLLNANEFIYRN